MGKENQIIGSKVPYVDARDKVLGAAVFGADVTLPGMLHGKLLRSPYPHAKILHIDIEGALRMPGVRAVVTSKNAPDTHFGISLRDERFFAKSEVTYIGDEVAAVVAVDEASAAAAIEKIIVDYEPLPAIFDPVEAMKPGSVQARNDMTNNIAYHTEYHRGDVEDGFRKAIFICEETFSLQHQYQAYIEPHVAVAQWKDGQLTVWTPHQSPRQLDKVMCEAFGLKSGGFQFIQPVLGGGFGGKTHLRVAPFAALLAKIVGAPVRIMLERDEDFSAGLPRVAMEITLKMGVDANGMITAKETHIVADNGAFTASALGVLEVAANYVDNLYRFTNIHTTGDLVYTNKLATSAFRGYGNTQVHFAVESMMDMIADRLNIDPAEIRLRNATQAGDITVHGRIVHSCGLSDAIRMAQKEINWAQKRGRQRDIHRGIGMACGVHGSGTTRISPTGAMFIGKVYEDGSVHIATSEGDIGQGAKTTLAIIASQELGIPLNQIYIDQLNTNETSFGVGAISSRVTVLGGNAVIAGASAIRKRLVEIAADQWLCPTEEVSYSRGQLINHRTEETLDIGQIASYFFTKSGGSRLIIHNEYNPEGVEPQNEKKFGNISLAYPFAVDVAEVEVDVTTGVVKVLSLLAVHDSGQVINLLALEGQIEGGLSQGLGYALSEEYVFKDGKVLNPDFTNYRIPTILDVPDLKVMFTNTVDPNGPFGAKSAGEIAMVPVAPAIANAIFDAIGKRMVHLPMTPERILLAVQSKH